MTLRTFLKKIPLVLFLLLYAVCGIAAGLKDPLMNSKSVVWAGLDYSMVRIIGGTDFEYDFKVPDVIFPGKLESWNQLFLDERIELVAQTLGRHVSVDIGGVTKRNKTATVNQAIMTPDPKDTVEKSHITPQDIAAEELSYKMENTNGLGLVLIVDRLVCAKTMRAATGRRRDPYITYQTAGAVYVVFFDVATRKIISSERQIHAVSGGSNFRNFWFGPIKSADKTLGKFRLLEPSIQQQQPQRHR